MSAIVIKIKALLIIAKVKAFLTTKGICVHCVTVSALAAMISAAFMGYVASKIIDAGVKEGLTRAAASAIYKRFFD